MTVPGDVDALQPEPPFGDRLPQSEQPDAYAVDGQEITFSMITIGTPVAWPSRPTTR